MKRKELWLIAVLSAVIIIFILDLTIKHSPSLRKIGEEPLSSPISEASGEKTQSKGGDAPGTKQQKSGSVSHLPWEKDRDFAEAQKRSQCGTCLAAYQTVLPDPLPGEEENVHLGARLLCGTVVLPGRIFSQNAAIGPYSQARGFRAGPTYVGTRLITTTGGGVCKIASTLYNVAVQSNLPIVERHAHSMPVPYVPYGQDATVSYGNKDLKFKNDTDHPIMIWAQGIDNVLYIAFYGQKPPPRIEWQHEFVQRYKSDTIYQTNRQIPQGDQRITVEGMDGGIVRSWIKIYRDSTHWSLKSMGLSYYSPLPRVVEKGGLSPAIAD